MKRKRIWTVVGGGTLVAASLAMGGVAVAAPHSGQLAAATALAPSASGARHSDAPDKPGATSDGPETPGTETAGTEKPAAANDGPGGHADAAGVDHQFNGTE